MGREFEMDKNIPIQINQYEQYQSQYELMRELNNDLIFRNFLKRKDAYSPHGIIDHTNKIHYIHWDNTVSIIDLKTSRINKAKEKIKTNNRISEKQANRIESINQKLITTLRKWEEQQSIKYTSKERLLDQEQDSITIRYNNIKKTNTLKKLYNDTFEYKDIFWKKDEKWNIIDLSILWKEYFSNTILGAFYSYNESNNFLSKNWRENLFPHNTYIGIREKLKNKQSLTTDEIIDFIDYLLQKTSKSENENETQRTQRHHHNMAKNHLINILYSMIYSEQKYNYNNTSTIHNWFQKSAKTIDETIRNNNNIKQEDIYTELWVKGLPSIAFKELRWEEVQDLLRWRTRIEDSLLQREDKYNIIEDTFVTAINNLKIFYEKQWYHIVIDSFNIANKFKDWDIQFDKDEIQRIEEYLQKTHTIEDNIFIKNKKTNTHARDFYEYDIINTSNQLITSEEKKIIQQAIDNDNSKTWGNWNYADIKFRMMFHLTKIDNPNKRIYNQSYEHMIVNMNSWNEWGLSDHNIFFDPIKNIPLKLRISTAIDIGIFMDSVSWWVDKTIKELNILQSYLDNLDSKPNHISKKFIKQQLLQRNKIPDEILKIAWIDYPRTYLELDKDFVAKEKIDNAVAEYLLNDQFKKWRLHRFIYDNDNLKWLSENLDIHLHKNKEISYTHKGHNKLLKKAIQEKEWGKICITWWWSNNLSKWCNSKLFSQKACIWIVNPKTDSIYFFTIPTFTWIVGEGTHIKNNEIKLWDIKSLYQKTLSNK